MLPNIIPETLEALSFGLTLAIDEKCCLVIFQIDDIHKKPRVKINSSMVLQKDSCTKLTKIDNYLWRLFLASIFFSWVISFNEKTEKNHFLNLVCMGLIKAGSLILAARLSSILKNQ